MGVDLGRLDAVMAEQFLNGANIHAAFQQVCGEGMSQAVAGNRLENPGRASGLTDGLAQRVVMHVMPPQQARTRIETRVNRGEKPLPAELGAGCGVFRAQSVRQPDSGAAFPPVLLPEHTHPLELGLEVGSQSLGQHDSSVLGSFGLANDDLSAIEIQILHSQTQAFERTHARAVHQPQHQARSPRGCGQKSLHLVTTQNGGQAASAAGTNHVLKLTEWPAQDDLIQEQQSRKGLVLGGGGYFPFDRQVFKKLLQVLGGERVRVHWPVKIQKALNPVHIGLLGAVGIMSGAQRSAGLSQDLLAEGFAFCIRTGLGRVGRLWGGSRHCGRRSNMGTSRLPGCIGGRGLPSRRRHHAASVGRQGSNLFRAGFDAESGRKRAGLVRFPVPVFDAADEDGQGLIDLGESAGVNRGLCVLERIEERLRCNAEIRSFKRVSAAVVQEFLEVPSPPVRLLGTDSNPLIFKKSDNPWRRTSVRPALGASWIEIHGGKLQEEVKVSQRKITLKCSFIG